MWLLGINIGHNGSTALFKDNELIFYIEEDRLSRWKYDGNPYLGMEKAYEYTDHIDYLIICATHNRFGQLPWTSEDPYACYIRKKQPYTPFELIRLGDEHHFTHATTAFYNSGFDEAAAIVIDGAGSMVQDEMFESIKEDTWETESIWSLAYPDEVTKHLAYYGSNRVDTFRKDEDEFLIEISDAHGITKTYEAVTMFLGFHAIEAGKTMGLAPYGKPNDSIKIHEGKYTNRSLIKPKFPASNCIRAELYPELEELDDKRDWHTNPSLVGEYRKDLAYAVQKSSEDRVVELIQKAIDVTGHTKIVMSGGYGLNCVANYEFLKRFPEIEFYHEPISHDGGNVIGSCQYVYRSVTKNEDPTPLTSLYLGPDNSVDYKQIDDIDKELFEISDTSEKEIAQMIADRTIVCLYQGRSEAGPRALGNRSILYDPTDPDGKDTVNEVKNREWFRPFAGTVLAEDVHEWFDLRTKNETPFMMYAVNVNEDKQDKIPAITHVDGTCRIQTVSESQNKNYYNLIKEFKNLTGVPVVFNTSFNLGGDPLVETLDEALSTLTKSDLKYLWLPEIGKLVTKKEID